MKTNLLTLVQNTLSAMNSDEVDDIDDTEESRQVTRIAEEAFYDLQSMREWAHKDELVRLIASGDNTQPTRMLLPEAVLRMHWVQYDKRESGDSDASYTALEYVEPEVFLRRSLNLNPDDSNVTQITDNVQDLVFNVYNDRHPSIYTSFSDEYIWCDAYLSTLDTTLQESKSLAFAKVMRSFTRSNTYTPDVPNRDWALYRNMVVAKCFEEIKQTAAPQTTSMLRRLLVRAQKDTAQRIDGSYSSVDFGRK